MKKPRLVVTVSVVIAQNGKYLLARRAKDLSFGGLWHNVGGTVEYGESIEQSIERELTEELGLKLRKEDETMFLFSYPWERKDRSMGLIFVFLIILQDDYKWKLKPSYESSECKWFSLEEAKELNVIGDDSATGTLAQIKCAHETMGKKRKLNSTSC